MGDAQHTAGPWTAREYTDGMGESAWAIEARNGEVTVVMVRESNSDVLSEANARLMAASPDLLEAAHGVDVLYAELQAALPALVGKPGWDVVQKAVEQARAAIAKAEGK